MKRSLVITVACAVAAAGAAMAAPPAPPATSAGPTKARVDSRDRIICRRFIRTGSLVDGYRTCKTRAEWDREHDNVRQFSVTNSCREMAEKGGC